jgi:hypothetical protein
LEPLDFFADRVARQFCHGRGLDRTPAFPGRHHVLALALELLHHRIGSLQQRQYVGSWSLPRPALDIEDRERISASIDSAQSDELAQPLPASEQVQVKHAARKTRQLPSHRQLCGD